MNCPNQTQSNTATKGVFSMLIRGFVQTSHDNDMRRATANSVLETVSILTLWLEQQHTKYDNDKVLIMCFM